MHKFLRGYFDWPTNQYKLLKMNKKYMYPRVITVHCFLFNYTGFHFRDISAQCYNLLLVFHCKVSVILKTSRASSQKTTPVKFPLWHLQYCSGEVDTINKSDLRLEILEWINLDESVIRTPNPRNFIHNITQLDKLILSYSGKVKDSNLCFIFENNLTIRNIPTLSHLFIEIRHGR